MEKAWMQNAQEDYKRLGLNPNEVEVWEDGKRCDDKPGYTEWWYFDAIMDDGTSAVIHFNTKTSGAALIKNGASPTVVISIMPPDGKEYTDTIHYKAAEASFSKEKCDVKFGPHRIEGNLTDYAIHVEPVNGIGADLKLHNLRKPWRPGTGHLSFGKNEKYFTWLFVVPKGEISGTITYEGKTIAVHGTGYHDHQWGTMNPANFNNWLWGRQHFEDYTILMFDVITSGKYGYERCPHFCIEDKEGNVVFDNCSCDAGFKVKIPEEYLEKGIQKKYPKQIQYTFGHDGKRVEYTLSVKHPILTQDLYHSGNKVMQMVMKMLHISPSYVRYKANGTMNLTIGGEKIKRSGELIYEFAYIGNEYKKYMERA